MEGAMPFWEDDDTDVDSTHLNQMVLGGNVYVHPNGGLFVNVTSLNYQRVNLTAGTITQVAYTGDTLQGVAASNTNYVYLNSSNALVINQSGFVADSLPLAEVDTDADSILEIRDARPHVTLFVA